MTDPDAVVRAYQRDPLLLAWSAPGNAGGFLSFETGDRWADFIGVLGIDPGIPQIVLRKFDRAQRLYLFDWLDYDLIKAGELAALIALELVVMDRYGGAMSKRKRSFATLLNHMVEADGLTGAAEPTLAERRNKLAHADPFDGMATGGLLKLICDLINYAYRDFIAGAATLDGR